MTRHFQRRFDGGGAVVYEVDAAKSRRRRGNEAIRQRLRRLAIRAITDHVYFLLDRNSPLWPEFSVATYLGMHFAGDWPELQMELWAIREDRR